MISDVLPSGLIALRQIPQEPSCHADQSLHMQHQAQQAACSQLLEALLQQLQQPVPAVDSSPYTADELSSRHVTK